MTPAFVAAATSLRAEAMDIMSPLPSEDKESTLVAAASAESAWHKDISQAQGPLPTAMPSMHRQAAVGVPGMSMQAQRVPLAASNSTTPSATSAATSCDPQKKTAISEVSVTCQMEAETVKPVAKSQTATVAALA